MGSSSENGLVMLSCCHAVVPIKSQKCQKQSKEKSKEKSKEMSKEMSKAPPKCKVPNATYVLRTIRDLTEQTATHRRIGGDETENRNQKPVKHNGMKSRLSLESLLHVL